MELEAYANQMFERGGDVSGKTAEEIFNTDYKIFDSGAIRFGVGQGSYMVERNRKAQRGASGPPTLPVALEKQGLDFVFYMFTDVPSASTELMMVGKGAQALVSKAFQVEVKDGIALLPGVVSRKKQLLPQLISTIKEDQDD